MKKISNAKKIFIDDVSKTATTLQKVSRGISIGEFINMIRHQLKMSQSSLAQRAKVPQSTISRIEKGQKDCTTSMLINILEALSCDLVIAPRLKEPIETIRRKQAMKMARKSSRYLQGTMNLELQEPSSKLLKKIVEQEENELLQGNGNKLWNEE